MNWVGKLRTVALHFDQDFHRCKYWQCDYKSSVGCFGYLRRIHKLRMEDFRFSYSWHQALSVLFVFVLKNNANIYVVRISKLIDMSLLVSCSSAIQSKQFQLCERSLVKRFIVSVSCRMAYGSCCSVKCAAQANIHIL